VKALVPGGRILVEDFRAEGSGERGLAWFQSMTRALRDAGLLGKLTPFLRQTLGEAEDHDHDHVLHWSSAIEEALRGSGGRLRIDDAAYWFRYWLPAVSEALASALLAHELEMLSAGLIDPLGRRYLLDPGSR
jgi:hypothetical protein